MHRSDFTASMSVLWDAYRACSSDTTVRVLFLFWHAHAGRERPPAPGQELAAGAEREGAGGAEALRGLPQPGVGWGRAPEPTLASLRLSNVLLYDQYRVCFRARMHAEVGSLSQWEGAFWLKGERRGTISEEGMCKRRELRAGLACARRLHGAAADQAADGRLRAQRLPGRCTLPTPSACTVTAACR